MPDKLTIYSLYKYLVLNKYYLLKTTQNAYNNSSQDEYELSIEKEEEKRNRLLKQIDNSINHFELFGQQQGFPAGQKLYLIENGCNLEIYYIETAFGFPWIILGTAFSEEDFLEEINDDDELRGLNPIGKPKKVFVTFITE